MKSLSRYFRLLPAVILVGGGLLALKSVSLVQDARAQTALTGQAPAPAPKDTIGKLNEAIVAAGSSMRMLKSTAAGAAEALDERISRGRSIADELSILTASGDRIAERMSERSSAPRTNNVAQMPASLSARMEALKPQALRNVR